MSNWAPIYRSFTIIRLKHILSVHFLLLGVDLSNHLSNRTECSWRRNMRAMHSLPQCDKASTNLVEAVDMTNCVHSTWNTV